MLYQLVIMETSYISETLGVHCYLTVTTTNSYIMHLLACCDLNKDMITAGQLSVNLWQKLNHPTFLAYLISA